MNAPMPTLYIPHGGGPCFFIKPEDMPPAFPKDMWDPMADYLRSVDAMVGRRPKAVIVISAHWMTPRPTLGIQTEHHLLFDYYNFPDYTYRLTYPAAGAPEVAMRAGELLAAAGMAWDTDNQRGIDHGVFVPFKLIYPDADVPIVPMSLQQNLNAADHLAIGRALAPLRDEDVLIVGSGMSFHNMRAMMAGGFGPEAQQFDRWLGSVNAEPGLSRESALARWDQAPGARESHPPGGEEHLIPLMVAAGAAHDAAGHQRFSSKVGNHLVSGFMFGGTV